MFHHVIDLKSPSFNWWRLNHKSCAILLFCYNSISLKTFWRKTSFGDLMFQERFRILSEGKMQWLPSAIVRHTFSLTKCWLYFPRSLHSSESFWPTWQISSRGSSATLSPTSRSSIASPTSAERAEGRRRWRSSPTAASTNKTRAEQRETKTK